MIQKLKVVEFLSSLKDKDGEIIHIGGLDYYNAIVALIEVFQLQDRFQQKAMAQTEWWKATVVKGRPVDYAIAMLGEVGEGIASLDFKWWSGLDTLDQENFITELVDALHFELSNVMRMFYIVEEIALEEETAEDEIHKLFKWFGRAVSNSFGYEQEHYETFNDEDRLNLIKEYIFQSLSKDRYCRQIKRIGIYDKVEFRIFLDNMFDSLYLLFELANAYGVSFETMIMRYKLKNALNHVRKMNGYKEGSYTKMWITPSGEKVEDNKAANALFVDGSSIPFDEMILMLDTYYKTTIAGK